MSRAPRLSSALPVLLGATIGYLAGSVSFSRLVGERLAPGEDLSITTFEIPETGATLEFRGITPTSVKQHAGTMGMLLATVLEAAKAAVPAAAMRAAFPDSPAAAAAATGAVVGHAFPATRGFRGGYGVSPMLGALLVLDPTGLVVTTLAVSGAIGVTRDQRLMMIWPVAVPVWGWVRGRGDVLAFGLAANAVYLVRWVPELRGGMRPVFEARRRNL